MLGAGKYLVLSSVKEVGRNEKKTSLLFFCKHTFFVTLINYCNIKMCNNFLFKCNFNFIVL